MVVSYLRECRICKSNDLENVISLNEQEFGSVYSTVTIFITNRWFSPLKANPMGGLQFIYNNIKNYVIVLHFIFIAANYVNV